MADDSEKKKERERILEEIRRRAEEEELQRLEEEEKKFPTRPPEKKKPPRKPEYPHIPSPPQGRPTIPPSTPPPPEEPTITPSTPPPSAQPSSPPPPPPSRSAKSQKAIDLADRIQIAVDRGKADKASDLLEQLRDIDPRDEQITEFEEMIEGLLAEQENQKRARQAAEELAREEEEKRQVEKEKKIKKVRELVESGDFYYQQEKYLKALESLDEALELDPENEEVIKFRETVEKAYQFAEQIKQEEERRKKEAPQEINEPKAEQTPPTGGDIWGTTIITPSETEFELPPAPETPKIVPQKAPILDTMVDNISRVQIPIKKILSFILIAAAGVTAYLVIDSIRDAVFPPNHALLIFPQPNETGDSTNSYLVEGLADDIIRELSHIKDLRVFNMPTSSSLLLFDGDASSTAKRLGADYYLNLQLTRFPDSISLHVELFDTLSRSPVCYIDQMIARGEFPSSGRGIALTLVDTMKIDGGREVLAALPVFRTPDARAFEFYLQGRYYLSHAYAYPISVAYNSFRQAVGFDSSFVRARTGLGWAQILMYENDVDTTQARLSSAWRTVQTPLALGAQSSEGYRVWGMVAFYRSQFDRALERLEQAKTIAPNDAETLRRLAMALVAKGNTDDALKIAGVALSCDPRNIDSYTVLGLLQLWAGDAKSAVNSFEQGRRLSPTPSEYASTYLSEARVEAHQHSLAVEILQDRVLRDPESFIEQYRLARVYQTGGMAHKLWTESLNTAESLVRSWLASHPSDAIAYAYLGLIRTRLGRFKEADAAARQAYRLAPRNYEVLYTVARIYALQNDREDEAYKYLTLAVDTRYRLDRLLDMDFFNLRSSDGFMEIAVR